jgi:uncharacterized cupredoxin-like copper-binding protein
MSRQFRQFGQFRLSLRPSSRRPAFGRRPGPSPVLLALLVPLAVVAAACGGEAGPSGQIGADGIRTVNVRMVDTAFEPASIRVQAGETVRFRFENQGRLPHDAFIGDAAAQAGHGADMGHDHGDDPAAVSVPAGGTAELVYTFDEAGETLIGCHQPGHYQAGMVATVTVTGA